MPVDPFRGGNSTTPDYWPTIPDVSQRQLNSWQSQYGFVPRSLSSVNPQQDSLNYFDALNFLKERRSANDFLIQRQQELEEQGAFVHPEETRPVDDSRRMEADEEYRNALIGIRKRYENSKGAVKDDVREELYQKDKENLEKWYSANTTETRPAYEDSEKAKRYLAWEDAKTENPSDYALDHAANDPWGQNEGVRSYRKFLEDRRQWAEVNGRRDLAHKYLQQLLGFDPTNGIKTDPLDLEAQKKLSEQWDKKAQKDRFTWESQIAKKARARKAAGALRKDTNLLELLNEALHSGSEQMWEQKDRFEAIKDSYGSEWTHDHTVAWDAMVAKAFRNKKAATEIQKADPRVANAARREAQSKNQRINERREIHGKHPLPLTASDVASSVRNIYTDFPDYFDPPASPPRPDENNFVPKEKTEEYEFFDPQAGFIKGTTTKQVGQTLEEAQAK